jgi:hypothetical protein
MYIKFKFSTHVIITIVTVSKWTVVEGAVRLDDILDDKIAQHLPDHLICGAL